MKTICVLALAILSFSVALADVPQEQTQFPEPGWFRSSTNSVPLTVEPIEQGEGGGNGSPTLIHYPEIAETVTPEIQALARGLENDPVRIYSFVHDHIRHVLYFGSKKGAQLTLLERSGNDFDQCSLLMALLRAAGHTNAAYQFGLLQMPFARSDHQDLEHWFALSLTDTNSFSVYSYIKYLFGVRAIPFLVWFGDDSFAFHRVWVRLTLNSTNYYLDPAFKVSEAINGIDLTNAMGFSSNAVWTAAGGSSSSASVQNLTEATLRSKLKDYTTNLLSTLQANYPNAAVEEILGGQRILSGTITELSQSTSFPIYTHGDQLRVVEWDNVPTNLMSTLNVSFAGTNRQRYLPELQGRRLSLSFSNNGVARLWLEDTQLLQMATSGGSSINVTQFVNHPHGQWDPASNALVDYGWDDQSSGSVAYQRTNATYVVLYGFEPDVEWLHQRQRRLDDYRQQGLSNSSREVVSETLNLIGLNWLIETDLAERAMATQSRELPAHHHRIGRVGQELGRGYYVDVFMQVNGLASGAGLDDASLVRDAKCFQAGAYLQSALEHGVIEHLQSSNLVAASSVKMLQLGNTNAVSTYLTSSANWATVRNSLTHYDLNFLETNYINRAYTLLLPQDGSRSIAGAGSWTGYGLVGRCETNGAMNMLISGNYNGGYVSSGSATTDPEFLSLFGLAQPDRFVPASAFQFPNPAADPVNMADGSFSLDEVDLVLGQAEPRGFTFSRHYNPSRRQHNLAGLAHGWLHNYYFNSADTSSPFLGLGLGTPAQMASMLVATRAALEFYDPTASPKNWAVTALIAKWGVDQLINNAVSISMGRDTIEFIKQPDASFTAPAKSTLTLLKTNSVYWLLERHGNTFKFDTKGRLTNIVDQYSQPLTISYLSSTSSFPQTVTDWKSNSLTFTYTSNRMTSVADSTGRSISYGYTNSYNANGDLASVTDAENKTRTFVYDTNHQMIATKNALGQTVVSNVYDDFGRVITQYSQGDTNKAWQLYWTGWENVEQDPAGGKRQFSYDDKHRLIALRDALSKVRQTFYDGQDHVVMTISPLDETNRFIYDGNHNLLQAIDPLNFTNLFVFDGQNSLVRTVDARGNTNRFGYNTKFQLTASTNGAGDWMTFAYNGTDGTLTNRTDAGGATAYGYDGHAWLNAITYPGSLGNEGFLNSSFGDRLSHTNARGFVSSYQYNQRRELTNAIAPTNVTTSVGYDAVGNVHSGKDARGFTTTNGWSATRKLLTTMLPGTPQGTPIITNAYDARDWLTRTVNPLQQATLFTNDAAQRLISATDPLQRTTKLRYDADGRKTASTNAALEVTRQDWNRRGELTNLTDAATHTIKHGYDGAGNQITLTNRNGKRWQFQFDAANRLTDTVSPSNRTNSQSWNNRGLLASSKEPGGDTATLTYDPKGRLTNRTDNVGTTTYRYDANNNVTNLVEGSKTNAWTYDAYDRVSTYKDADANLIQYRYDANGNLTNLIYPGNRTVTYAYDALNRLTNVTDWAGRQTAFAYDLASRLTNVTRPNGTLREIRYDAAAQATNIIERLTNNAPITFFKLNWNTAGRVAWEFAAPLPHSNAPPSRTMTFDHDNRLATFNGSYITNDSDGNLVWGPLTNSTLGNLAYDARNRLLSAGGVTNAYDALNNRIGQTYGTNTIAFVVNPNAPLPQLLIRIKGGLTNFYIYGAGLLYQVTETATTTNTLTYHYDYRGSTVALTDANGIPTDRIEYSAYGMTTYHAGTNETPFLFNGRYGVQTDPNGLLYMRARYYNPFLCRFLNADPAGFGGGLNFYAYADGNPVSRLDPFGLSAVGEGFWSWLGRQMDSLYNSLGSGLLGPVDYGDGSVSYDSAAFGPGADRYFSAVEQEAQRYEVGRDAVWTAASMIPYERILGTIFGQGERVLSEFSAGGTGANRIRVNIFGEGEAPGFIDVSSNARFANGRPLTSSFGNGSATDIFIRNSPITGENTISEILRLSQPGTRLTLMQPASGFQGQALIDAFGSRAGVDFIVTFQSQTVAPGVDMTILRMIAGGGP